MVRARFTAGLSAALVLSVLLACKKKPDADAAASASAAAAAPAPSTAAPAPAPVPAPTPAATGDAPKLGDVKRYGVDKESKLDGSGVRVTADEVKVFNEGDTKTAEVATLPKNLLVFRLVKMDTFTLVEFPSGIGQFSQGWVETSALSDQPEKVTREAALGEKKTATVKVGDAGAPAPKASASSSAAPKASASAAPKASASAAPKASASAAPKATATATSTTKAPKKGKVTGDAAK
jgi:hypothetical protein